MSRSAVSRLRSFVFSAFQTKFTANTGPDLHVAPRTILRPRPVEVETFVWAGSRLFNPSVRFNLWFDNRCFDYLADQILHVMSHSLDI